MSYGTKTRSVHHTAIVDFQRSTYRDPVTLTATEVCPHCKRQVTTHRFTTGDGQPITTYHCPEHSDVVPMRSLVVRDDPPPQETPSRNINDEHT